ncbi:MAG: hypothetical protein JXA68_05485 [Ignavibacteriales bacterium]|nr:hypothetical protein [Ignavibacteriales bacterium]
MKKYLLFILIALIIFQLPIYGQSLNKSSFVIYEEVINELKSAKNISQLENKYDYVFILLLDSTNIDLIIKTGYPYINEFRNYAASLALSKKTIGFVTEKQYIKEIFNDENSLKRILTCTKTNNSPDIPMTKFDYPVYIKGNTAVFETSGPTWTDTYYARLEKGIFQINWLGGIIE